MDKQTIKKVIGSNFFGAWIMAQRERFNNWRYYQKRKPYIQTLTELLVGDLSIISSNCFAGRIMQDLKMEYNSPTLGLWMMPDDFAVFCGDLKHYLSADIEIVEHSKNDLGEYFTPRHIVIKITKIKDKREY